MKNNGATQMTMRCGKCNRIINMAGGFIGKRKTNKNPKLLGKPSLISDGKFSFNKKTKMQSYEAKIFCGRCKTQLFCAKVSSPFGKGLEFANRCVDVMSLGGLSWLRSSNKHLPKIS